MKLKIQASKTTLIFFLCFAFYSVQMHAQATAIPDANFEQALITLGIDTDGLNGQILNSDAAVVTNLNVSNANISNLTGIAAFVNLQGLECDNNNLTSLDVSGMTALVNLFCEQNSLTSLDVTGNVALGRIQCSNNNLTNLDVSGNPALWYLSCEVNSLTSLDLSANPLLEYLYSRDNNLTSLNIGNITSLVSFHCENNNLTSLDVSGNPAMDFFRCNDNSLTSLDVTGNTALGQLYCDQNNLVSLNLSTNQALEYLICDNNSLISLDLTGNSVLKYLRCDNNNLTSLDVSAANTALWSLYCDNNNLTNLDLGGNTVLGHLYCDNNSLTNLDISTADTLRYLDCRSNLPNLTICVQDLQAAINNSFWQKDNSATYLENCYPLAVVGRLVIDNNSNCIADSLERGMLGQLVEFVRISDASTFYFSTYDTLGTYAAFLDTGTYNVSVIPHSSYWQVCPSSQQVTIDSSYVLQTLDWTLDPLVLCPDLTVDVSAPFLRMTGGGSNYTVSYCNYGSITAHNVYVEVDLDIDLNVIGTSLPIASQMGSIYTFNLDSVEVGACGNFTIQVLVDTTAEFEQTHCTEVHLYPDSSCHPIWTEPRVTGSIACQSDSVLFYVENIGAAMLQPQPYTVIEDNIAMRTGTIQLGAGQSTTITQFAAQGKTYRIEVDQVSGFPAYLGDSVFSAAIEGCNPYLDESFNTGFITQFSNGHSAPFLAIDCQQNIASYDPNDKSAQPEGYGTAHYIYNYTPIDYKVRFQNTGTDTAFNVVIDDAISPYLDLTTLQMGASSHAYDWTIENGNVLKVSFLNIMLVDSNANEPLSHGFFRYRIEQKTNNPLGAVINNQAAIYFDYNPPIFTNTTFHTIGENFVTTIVSVDKIFEEEINVVAFPNPFTDKTTIKVEGKAYESLELSIFDVTGRAVAQEQTSFSPQIELSRGDLQTGVYFYRLSGDSKLISSGKIVVQ